MRGGDEAARHVDTARCIRDFDLAFENSDGGALLDVVDADVELRALEACVDVRRAEAQRARVPVDNKTYSYQ